MVFRKAHILCLFVLIKSNMDGISLIWTKAKCLLNITCLRFPLFVLFLYFFFCLFAFVFPPRNFWSSFIATERNWSSSFEFLKTQSFFTQAHWFSYSLHKGIRKCPLRRTCSTCIVVGTGYRYKCGTCYWPQEPSRWHCSICGKLRALCKSLQFSANNLDLLTLRQDSWVRVQLICKTGLVLWIDTAQFQLYSFLLQKEYIWCKKEIHTNHTDFTGFCKGKGDPMDYET